MYERADKWDLKLGCHRKTKYDSSHIHWRISHEIISEARCPSLYPADARVGYRPIEGPRKNPRQLLFYRRCILVHLGCEGRRDLSKIRTGRWIDLHRRRTACDV